PLRERPAARLRRHARQVDGAHRRRGAPGAERQPPSPRPAGRSPAGPARPLAPERVGTGVGEPKWSAGCRPVASGRGPGRPAGLTRSAPVATRLDPKHNSRALTEGPARAPARAYLYGIGFDEEALAKPIVGVANTWIEAMPCNFHLRALSAKVKEGIRDAGGTPMEFNTIAISDGITMGTSGMKTSLVSRELIADSIELASRGYLFDAVVAISGCDKTIPGTVMALARLDVPSVMLYGGSIYPGRFNGHDVTIQDVFEAVGRPAAGDMTDEQLDEPTEAASPGSG